MERLEEFDYLRAIATLTVIGIHISAAYILISPLGYTTNQLARFAVPLFIIMSGFLLFYSDLKKPLKTGEFYLKRTNKIVKPYIIWTFIYYVLALYFSKMSFNVNEFIYHILLGTASYHLYFVVIIMQMYLLYPLLKYSMIKNSATTVLISLLLTVSFQVILYFDMQGFKLLPPQYTYIYLVIFPVWIFYFVFGMLAVKERDKWKLFTVKNKTCITIIWLFSIGLLFLDSKITLTYATSIRPSVIFYTLSSYFFLYLVATRLKEYGAFLVSWLSDQAFLIYLIHPLILIMLLLIPDKLGIIGIWHYTRGMILQYIITVILSLGAVYVISLTPWAQWLGGIRKK